MSIPKAFISYSHDSIEHKNWVLQLGSRLRSSGIDAVLDQWELSPGDDLPHFMETNLSSSNFILMICTERYITKANNGHGGVGYEKMIVTSNLLSSINENKIIPIIRQDGSFEVPVFLKTKLFIDFSKNDDFEFSFDELIRKIHNSPIYEKPEIGENPFKNLTQVSNSNIKGVQKVAQKAEPIKELMKILSEEYEKGNDYVSSFVLKDILDISRIMMDLIISEGISQDLFKIDRDGDLSLTLYGKHYIIKNNIAK